MIDSRNLNDLLPVVRAKAESFIAACKAKKIDILITSTLRDIESQNALYAKGRSTPGNNPTPSRPMGSVVTNARGGESFHNYACAFDFVPIVNGKAAWNDEKLFIQCGQIAESVGLEWAGRWKSFKEMAHCQYTGGLTLQDLKNGKKVM